MEYYIYISLILILVIIISIYLIKQRKSYYYDKKSLMSLYKYNGIDKNDETKLFEYKTESITSVGGRKVNEDSLKFSLGDISFWVVCDGLGGLNKGEVASGLAVSNFEEKFNSNNEFSEDRLIELIYELNNIIIDVANEKSIKMATTITAVLANKDSILFGYLGDTRLYYFRDKKLVFHTKDHSIVQRYVDIGKIDYDNIRKNPDRNILTRVLGVENICETDSISIPIKVCDGDVILICSDGFWEYVLENEMESLLEDNNKPKDWLKSMELLILKRVENLRNDNYTAISIFVSSQRK
ncbi:MAG: PP2C family serine/threonine-protein phosphatase [Clostridiales bacterium]